MFYDYSVVSKEAVIQIGIMIILTLMLFGLIRHDRRVKIPAVFPYVAILLVYVAFTLAWAVNPFEGFSIALHWSISALAILIIANVVNKDHLILTFFLSGAAVAIIGLFQNAFGLDFFQQVIPPASTFAHKNFAAHYVAVCLPLGFCVREKIRLRFIIGLAFGMVAYILICETRASMLAVGAAGGFFVTYYLPKRYRLKVAVFSSILAVLLSVAYLNYYGAGWDTGRLKIWKSSAQMAVDHPFGVGVGNFRIHSPAYYDATPEKWRPLEQDLDYAHNDLLQLWDEAGFVGIVLFALMFIGIIKRIDFKRWPHVAASIICIGVVSSFGFPLQLPVIPFTGACLLGVLSK